ncbi:hypothetical protein [Hyphomonas sp.]|uniref:hypothetical protein n=1 Tax=Hyphomonas sp. TaxID=87 RepID=UPI00391A12AD
MSDWKIKSDTPDTIGHAAITLASLGLNLVFGDKPLRDFVIENRSTGETREVKAQDADDLGRKIARGEI